MQRNWKIKLDGRNLTTNQIVDQILKNRGILDVESFLHPTKDYLLPFEQLHNIDKAKDIIVETINNDGKFFIYGDVDTDGCTSTAIMYRYIKNFTKRDIRLYINNGKEHGVDEKFDFDAKLEGIDTVIIVDSVEDEPKMYQEILKRNVKLVVLDHHVPTPEILAMKDDICLVSSAVDYPNKYLSGAGVCWKMCAYLDTIFNTTYADNLVDLACVGLIADVSSVGVDAMENRYICYRGFQNLVNPALKQIIGTYSFNAKAVSFSIAPLINVANRLENNDESLKIFIMDEPYQIADTIENMKKYKEFQKTKINSIYESVISKQAQNQLQQKCMYFLVEDARNFLGVIASRAANDYARPVIVVADREKNYEGSMRSVGVPDFRKIINDTELASCNGHEMAAGISIPKTGLVDFCNKVEESLSTYQFDYDIPVDVQITTPQISNLLIRKLEDVNLISGADFPSIKVMIDDVKNYTVKRMSNGKHLNIEYNDVSFIEWNFSDWGCVKEGKKLSAVGSLEPNTFSRTISYNVIMDDFKFSE